MLLATAAAFFFSVDMILIRKATVTGSSLDAVIASVWINSLVFLPMLLVFYFPDISLTPKMVGAFVMDGLLGTFLARICLYTGIKEVGASRASPISQGNVLVSMLFGVLILGEVITGGHLVGILLLTFGIVIVSYEIESDQSIRNWKPSLELLLPLGAMLFLGLSAPFGKIGYNCGAPVLLGVSIKALAGLGFLTAFFYSRGDSPLHPFRAREKKLYLLVGISQTAAFGLLYAALSVARVTVVMPFRSLTPFFVLVVSSLFLSKLEKITWEVVLGVALTVVGAILVGIFM